MFGLELRREITRVLEADDEELRLIVLKRKDGGWRRKTMRTRCQDVSSDTRKRSGPSCQRRVKKRTWYRDV
ncbi:hypothetical protein DVH05_008911 [Phytophthora capsici]|nr:hypothetical protein DVH05_008911 [Phytophthora capsici]